MGYIVLWLGSSRNAANWVQVNFAVRVNSLSLSQSHARGTLKGPRHRGLCGRTKLCSQVRIQNFHVERGLNTTICDYILLFLKSRSIGRHWPRMRNAHPARLVMVTSEETCKLTKRKRLNLPRVRFKSPTLEETSCR